MPIPHIFFIMLIIVTFLNVVKTFLIWASGNSVTDATQLACLEGLEPPALGLEGRCSIRLSYKQKLYFNCLTTDSARCFCLLLIKIHNPHPLTILLVLIFSGMTWICSTTALLNY